MPDAVTVEYLWPFIQNDYPSKETALKAFSQWRSDDDAAYDQVLDFDLSELTPLVTDGYKPDNVKPISEWPALRWTRSISVPAPTVGWRTCG